MLCVCCAGHGDFFLERCYIGSKKKKIIIPKGATSFCHLDCGLFLHVFFFYLFVAISEALERQEVLHRVWKTL